MVNTAGTPPAIHKMGRSKALSPSRWIAQCGRKKTTQSEAVSCCSLISVLRRPDGEPMKLATSDQQMLEWLARAKESRVSKEPTKEPRYEYRSLKTLTTKNYVRTGLNQARVYLLKEILEALLKEVEEGKRKPEDARFKDPLLITADGQLMDGRHRKEVYELCGIDMVLCEISPLTEQKDIIAEAWARNSDASLPPDAEAFEHTVIMFRVLRCSQKEIAERMRIPLNYARKIISKILHKETQRLLAIAATDMSENDLSVSKAAEKHGVDLKQLKDYIKPRRNKRGKSNVDTIKALLTKNATSFGTRQGRLMKTLFERFEDGEMNPAEFEEIFEQLRKGAKTVARTVGEWESRFRAMVKPV